MKIPYARQDVSQKDIEAVVSVLKSDWLTQGPMVGRFEQAVAGYCGAKHAVAVNSGTSALHIACLALGLGPSDRLWTSPNTFVASANCALHCGAEIDFVDIDPETGNISIDELRGKLERAQHERALPKVVVPVHFAGQSCAMSEIHELSNRYGFRIIEDATHALGGRYKGDLVGGCRYSDITVFSFHPVKSITTGEGGMVVTNDNDIADSLRLLRSHGITRDVEHMRDSSDGPWYYEQLQLGFNNRMNDMQAALGMSQMQRLDAFIRRRNELADRYDERLRPLPVKLLRRTPDAYSSFHLYVIRLAGGNDQVDRATVFRRLSDAEVAVNVHYIPVHAQPYYRQLGFGWGNFPQAEQHYREAISLPMYYGLSLERQEHVVVALGKALE